MTDTHFVSGESQYVPLSEAELLKLAHDVVAGKVFGTWDIPQHDRHVIPKVFMFLAFWSDIKLKELDRDRIEHFYERTNAASSAIYNSYPVFTTAFVMNRDDFERMSVKINEIEDVYE